MPGHERALQQPSYPGLLNDMRCEITLMQQEKLVKSGKQIIKSGKIYRTQLRIINILILTCEGINA